MKDIVRSDLPASADLNALERKFFLYLDASPRTAQTYKTNIRQFVKWTRAHGISDPTREDLIAFRDELKTRCKPSTVQNYVVALRLFFQWVAKETGRPNIAEHIKGAKVDPKHKEDYLTAAQVQDLLDSIDTSTARGKRDYAIIALMVTGGLRDIEVSRANKADLRQLGTSTVLYLQGKGREERTEYVRIVPEVERALRQWLQLTAYTHEPLFISMSNNSYGQRLTPRSISSIVKARMIAAGYNSPTLTAHSLRHSAVTLALLGGLPIEEVQQFARHRSIATTLVYAHHLKRADNRSEGIIANSIFRERTLENDK